MSPHSSFYASTHRVAAKLFTLMFFNALFKCQNTEIHHPAESKVTKFMETPPPTELCFDSNQNAPDGLRHANNSMPANLHLEAWSACPEYALTDSITNGWGPVCTEGDAQVYAPANPTLSSDRSPPGVIHNSDNAFLAVSSQCSAFPVSQTPVSQVSCTATQSHFDSLSFEEQSAMCADLLANYDPSSPFMQMDEDSGLPDNVSPNFLLEFFPGGLAPSSTGGSYGGDGPDRSSETLNVSSQDSSGNNRQNHQYQDVFEAKTANFTAPCQNYALFRQLDNNTCKVAPEFCTMDSFMDLS
ncbi:unnamed protein product [Dibothriocephalus latus]|uniref:Uncharacterized protein n=1 Tax=Dibothriocephalus latus TaxID=60516 RepID=A0A3P7M2E7_DIBLA|nr:unnamed protein product [Dibothriocephalus latus]